MRDMKSSFNIQYWDAFLWIFLQFIFLNIFVLDNMFLNLFILLWLK